MGNTSSKPAIGLGIAASLAVPGECRKRNGSTTKSSKDPDTIHCSTETLTRSNVVTNLVFANVADENNVINLASLEEFCNANRTAAFAQAIGNSAGSLVDPNCAVQDLFAYTYFGAASVTEGELQADTINTLCYAEQSGEVLPVEGCNYTDPCEVINGLFNEEEWDPDDWPNLTYNRCDCC